MEVPTREVAAVVAMVLDELMVKDVVNSDSV